MKFNISCIDIDGDMSPVINIETQTNIEFKLQITNDLEIQLRIRKFKINKENSLSFIGKVRDENIDQLLSILSKIMYSLLNSWFDRGYKIPLEKTELIYLTFNTINVGHGDGYLYIHAAPNFEQFNLLELVQMGLKSNNITVSDLLDIALNGGKFSYKNSTYQQ